MRQSVEISKMKLLKTFDWREFACGWGAAFVNITVTYPIYKIIFRQMLHGIKFTSAFSQLRNEGLIYLYRGIFPPLAQKSISLSVMFGVYDGTKRPLIEHLGVNLYCAKIIGGGVAGSFEAVLLPFERVQTLLADAKYHQYFKNTAESFRYVFTNYGLGELYRGLVPVLWRNGGSNALFFMLREEASERYLIHKEGPTRKIQEFLAGAVIGASLSAFFYPLNVIKIAMQSDMGHRRDSMFKVAYDIYVARGRSLRQFYRGCWFNSSRAFLSWGIMNAAYENIKLLIY